MTTETESRRIPTPTSGPDARAIQVKDRSTCSGAPRIKMAKRRDKTNYTPTAPMLSQPAARPVRRSGQTTARTRNATNGKPGIRAPSVAAVMIVPSDTRGTAAQLPGPSWRLHAPRGLARDNELLVGRDDVNRKRCVMRANAAFDARRGVETRIEPEPAPLHALADAGADLRRVFPDPSGEDDGLSSAQGREIGPDVLPGTVAEDIEGGASRRVLGLAREERA